MKIVSTQELLERIDTGKVTIFEILPMAYFSQGHLPSAIQADIGDVGIMSKKLGLDLNSSIVTYCASETCPNSHQAASLLESLGYKNVSVYAGGKKEWLESGFELNK